MDASRHDPRAAAIARRRELQASLGGPAAALPSVAARAQSGPADLATSPLKTLVLGAGMAGLTAALALLDAHGGTFTSASPALGSMPDLAYHFGDQNHFRIRGGNDLLPRAMADASGDRILLDAPVTAIDQTGPRVKVTVEGGREFTADAMISTIPFSVIQEIEVRPAWSRGKRRMFAEMEWDNTVKVIAQTTSPAWLAKGVHGWPMAGGDRP